MEILTGEDAGIEIGFELGPVEVEDAVVTRLLELLVAVDDEGVRGA